MSLGYAEELRVSHIHLHSKSFKKDIGILDQSQSGGSFLVTNAESVGIFLFLF